MIEIKWIDIQLCQGTYTLTVSHLVTLLKLEASKLKQIKIVISVSNFVLFSDKTISETKNLPHYGVSNVWLQNLEVKSEKFMELQAMEMPTPSLFYSE